MIHVDNTFEVRGRSPEVVFDFIADFRNQARWNDDQKDIVKLTDGDVARGTRFSTVHVKGGPLTMEVVEHDRPRRLAFRFVGKSSQMDFTASFSSTGQGARVVTTTDMRMGGAARLLAPLIQLAMRRQLPGHQAKLAAYLEREAP